MWGSSDAWRGSRDVGLGKNFGRRHAGAKPARVIDIRDGSRQLCLPPFNLETSLRSPLPMIVLSCSTAF